MYNIQPHRSTFTSPASPKEGNSKSQLRNGDPPAYESRFPSPFEKHVKAPKDTPRWIPGHLQNIPWFGILALLTTILCMVGSVVVLNVSDGQLVSRWIISPTVYLAIFTAIGNSCIQFAQSEGVNISWWYSALNEGTTVGDLHRTWAFGTSLVSAGRAGRRVNIVAVASILAAWVAIDGPLLQKASSVVAISFEEAITLRGVTLEEVPKDYANEWADERNLGKIFKSFNKKEPITANVTGCTDTCKATVRAPALARTNCTTTSIPVDGYDSSAPSEGFFINFEQTYYDSLAMTVVHAALKNCTGAIFSTTCALVMATAAYPVIIRDRNTISFAESPANARIIRITPNDVQNDILVFPTALMFLVNQSFGSTASWREKTTQFGSTFSAQYNDFDLDSPCNSFSDPTDDVMAGLNELVFRTGVNAEVLEYCRLQVFRNPFIYPCGRPNATDILGVQLSQKTMFVSHYPPLLGALAVMAVGILSILPTYRGFWKLGRPVTLSPIEIGRAFGAIVLGGCDANSNMDIEELIKVIGKRKVRYGAVNIAQSSGNGSGEGDCCTSLQFSHPEVVRTPEKGLKVDM